LGGRHLSDASASLGARDRADREGLGESRRVVHRHHGRPRDLVTDLARVDVDEARDARALATELARECLADRSGTPDDDIVAVE
jgi:hypothetical protein